jgi:hypothetical protein
MTKDEEKAIQEDNQYFMTDEQNKQAQDILWVLAVTAICFLILLGIFILEVMEL